jgi:hypothetical protein
MRRGSAAAFDMKRQRFRLLNVTRYRQLPLCLLVALSAAAWQMRQERSEPVGEHELVTAAK